MRKLLFLTLLLPIVLLLGCTEAKNEPTTVAVDTMPLLVTRVQECSRLYTTECHIRKIITHSDKTNVKGKLFGDSIDIDLPFGERRVAIPMEATVKAYIDFAAFSAQNVQRNGDKLTILLPDPRFAVTATRISHDEVRQHVPTLRSDFSDAELSDYERQGRADILKTLPQLGLVEKARLSAARTLVPLFVAMGFKEQDITITFRNNLTDRDVPSLIDGEIETSTKN